MWRWALLLVHHSCHGQPPNSRCAALRCPLCLLQATYEKLLTEVPKYKMITPSVLSDRLRVRFVEAGGSVSSSASVRTSRIAAG